MKRPQLEWLRDAIENANPTDCIIWPFAQTNGYGVMQYDNRQTYAHRVSLVLFSGFEPIGDHVLHGPCHDKLCVNPHHLSWGTTKQNMADKLRDGTHLCGSKCGSAKLREQDVIEIRTLAGRVSHRELASKFNVSEKYISCVVTGRTWSWLLASKLEN